MDLPTYTSIWRIEKRLYKLYDLRLPMPLPLVQIGVFAGMFIPWVLVLRLVGIPFKSPWHVLYLVPPFVLTFAATRPVIEGKRLTELLLSHTRYLSEPRTWCRLTPIREPREVVVVGRVWRRADHAPERAAVKATRRSRKARRQVEQTAPAAPPVSVPGGLVRRLPSQAPSLNEAPETPLRSTPAPASLSRTPPPMDADVPVASASPAPDSSRGSGKRALASGVRRPGAPADFWDNVTQNLPRHPSDDQDPGIPSEDVDGPPSMFGHARRRATPPNTRPDVPAQPPAPTRPDIPRRPADAEAPPLERSTRPGPGALSRAPRPSAGAPQRPQENKHPQTPSTPNTPTSAAQAPPEPLQPTGPVTRPSGLAQGPRTDPPQSDDRRPDKDARTPARAPGATARSDQPETGSLGRGPRVNAEADPSQRPHADEGRLDTGASAQTGTPAAQGSPEREQAASATVEPTGQGRGPRAGLDAAAPQSANVNESQAGADAGDHDRASDASAPAAQGSHGLEQSANVDADEPQGAREDERSAAASLGGGPRADVRGLDRASSAGAQEGAAQGARESERSAGPPARPGTGQAGVGGPERGSRADAAQSAPREAREVEAATGEIASPARPAARRGERDLEAASATQETPAAPPRPGQEREGERPARGDAPVGMEVPASFARPGAPTRGDGSVWPGREDERSRATSEAAMAEALRDGAKESSVRGREGERSERTPGTRGDIPREAAPTRPDIPQQPAADVGEPKPRTVPEEGDKLVARGNIVRRTTRAVPGAFGQASAGAPTPPVHKPTERPTREAERPAREPDRPTTEPQGPANEPQRPEREAQGLAHEAQPFAQGVQRPAHEAQRPAHETQGPEREAQRLAHEGQSAVHEVQSPEREAQGPVHEGQGPAYAAGRPVDEVRRPAPEAERSADAGERAGRGVTGGSAEWRPVRGREPRPWSEGLSRPAPWPAVQRQDVPPPGPPPCAEPAL
ncbi:TcpE family conjugal transfer membrane protein, partial [Actinomadura harenae]|uniref:TcpE family conjugal transfer membrane protein n=1 Tax=Actinomadura harenae TaxID=2483351 RepID=UPI0022792CB2